MILSVESRQCCSINSPAPQLLSRFMKKESTSPYFLTVFDLIASTKQFEDRISYCRPVYRKSLHVIEPIRV